MGAQECQEEQRLIKESDPEVIARRNALFQKYVVPFYNMIYKLCIRYSFSSRNVEENYTEVLVNFFRRIETYDPNRPIRTWLHVCTKRHVFSLERRRRNQEIPSCDDRDIGDFDEEILYDNEPNGNSVDVSNYSELYSDDILSALSGMKKIHRDSFLLQEAGYSLKEIAEIEYRNGSLKSKNIETIKSRLFSARKYLKKHLTRDGKRICCPADDEDFYSDCC